MLPLYVTSQRASQSIKPVSRPSHPTITHIEYWDLENYLHRAHRAVRSSAWVQPHPAQNPPLSTNAGHSLVLLSRRKNTHRICIFWIKGERNQTQCLFNSKLGEEKTRLVLWITFVVQSCLQPRCKYKIQRDLDIRLPLSPVVHCSKIGLI